MDTEAVEDYKQLLCSHEDYVPALLGKATEHNNIL